MSGAGILATDAGGSGLSPLEVERIRRDFPILEQKINGKPLVYLDNAATTQKPLPVLDAIRRHYAEDCANVHRGVHHLKVACQEEA